MSRSAKGAIPPDAPRMTYEGEQWVQLWDADEGAYYWYCERTQAAQWEMPGEEPYGGYLSDVPEDEASSRPDTGYDSTGYESERAMTDYSEDHFDDYSRGTTANSEFAAEGSVNHGIEWEEYYDEQAQANYWYNNLTVSAI